MILAEKASYPVRLMCEQLEVSPSGYYAWEKRKPSKRKRQDELLKEKIAEVFLENRQVYGSPRIHNELKSQGFKTGRNRIARLMGKMGLSAQPRRRFRKTTDSNHKLAVAENLLGRNFDVAGPNQVWATDITYIQTWEGWLYLAVVLDLFSRRVVGWSMGSDMKTTLVLRALDMALGLRGADGDLVHHSDRGSQYASEAYRAALESQGITCSMSRKGDCWDNAVVESFFGTLKRELVYRQSWPTRLRARAAVHEYVEVFYNRRRSHSYLGYKSPAEYERSYWQGAALAA